MKKLLAIVLCVCIFIEVAGYFFIYLVSLNITRQEVHQYLASCKDFGNTVLVLKKNIHDNHEQRWEHENEFRYDGLMYDVVEKYFNGDSVYIKCVADEKESLLIKKIEEAVSTKSANSSSKGASITLGYTTNFYLPVYRTEVFKEECDRINFAIDNNNSTFEMSYDILKPPPQSI